MTEVYASILEDTQRNSTHLDEKDRDLLLELRHLFSSTKAAEQRSQVQGQGHRQQSNKNESPDSRVDKSDQREMFPSGRFNLRYNRDQTSDKILDLKRKHKLSINGEVAFPPIERATADQALHQKTPRTEDHMEMRDSAKFPYPPKVSFVNFNNQLHQSAEGVEVQGRKLDSNAKHNPWAANERTYINKTKERGGKMRHLRSRTKEQRESAVRQSSRNKKADDSADECAPIALKIRDIDVAFNVRKKIEQFKSWHEVEYKRRISQLKQDMGREKTHEVLRLAQLYKEQENRKMLTEKERQRISQDSSRQEAPHAPDSSKPTDVVDLEDSASANVIQDAVSAVMKETTAAAGNNNNNGNPGLEEEGEEEGGDRPSGGTAPDNNNLSPQAAKKKLQRQMSALTWKTWRGVNDSYCYNDVKKYISENELMSHEKETRIKRWVADVDRAMYDALEEDSIATDNWGKTPRTSESKSSSTLFPPIDATVSPIDMED